MNLQRISKGVNSCNKNPKSKTDEVSTHVPTIKCHEEVMSKLSSCTNEDCVGDPDSCVKQYCDHREQKMKIDKIKTVTSKCKLGHHKAVNPPGIRTTGFKRKEVHPKTVKSKSASTIHTPRQNLEHSVDMIPVKLMSTTDNVQKPTRKARKNFDSRLSLKEKTPKPNRPTWDQILRNNLEIANKPVKCPSKKSLRSDNHTKNCCCSDHSCSRSCTPKKKASPRKSVNYQVQDDPKQGSEFSKPIESPQSDKLRLFQHINPSDPIKTLDFLIRQLRDGLLRQPHNDSLQNIILDMENALLRISDTKSLSVKPLDKGMAEKDYIVDNIPSSVTSSSSQEKIRNKHLDILQLEENLEKSCRYLQSLCIKQKESCSNHLREKEQLSLQLAESRRLLTVSKSKEKNYEVIIGELRLKLLEANTKIGQLKQSLQDVENKNATLKEENQAMKSLKDSLKRVGVRLKQVASEKENLQSKLSLKDLEIEKLKVLLQVKTTQNTDLKQDNLLLDKNDLDVKVSDDEKDLSVISMSTVTSWSDRGGLICSSQASSTPRHSPSPYNSWQHISSIVQQPSAAADINRGIAVILQDLKKKSEQLEPLRLNLQSPVSCSSLWSDREAGHPTVLYSDGESVSFGS